MKKKNLMQSVLEDVYLYGGLPFKYGDIIMDVQRRIENHRHADWFLFCITQRGTVNMEPLGMDYLDRRFESEGI